MRDRHHAVGEAIERQRATALDIELETVVGGIVALSLLDAGLRTRSSELQGAAAVVGIAAGAIWLAGRAANPEADLRQVIRNFESGYLIFQ